MASSLPGTRAPALPGCTGQELGLPSGGLEGWGCRPTPVVYSWQTQWEKEAGEVTWSSLCTRVTRGHTQVTCLP